MVQDGGSEQRHKWCSKPCLIFQRSASPHSSPHTTCTAAKWEQICSEETRSVPHQTQCVATTLLRAYFETGALQNLRVRHTVRLRGYNHAARAENYTPACTSCERLCGHTIGRRRQHHVVETAVRGAAFSLQGQSSSSSVFGFRVNYVGGDYEHESLFFLYAAPDAKWRYVFRIRSLPYIIGLLGCLDNLRCSRLT